MLKKNCDQNISWYGGVTFLFAEVSNHDQYQMSFYISNCGAPGSCSGEGCQLRNSSSGVKSVSNGGGLSSSGNSESSSQNPIMIP